MDTKGLSKIDFNLLNQLNQNIRKAKTVKSSNENSARQTERALSVISEATPRVALT